LFPSCFNIDIIYHKQKDRGTEREGNFNSLLKKQKAGHRTHTGTQTSKSVKQKDALQSEESRKRKVLITYNILHKQGPGPTPELKRHNPASRKGTLYNPKKVERGRF
jgi:hypothetical protein